MAKKKKGKRHRNPVAPPVHSAPAGATYQTGPAGGQPTQPPPARPMGAEPPASEAAVRPDVPRRVRQTPAQRRNEIKRKQRRRNLIIATVVGVLVIGGIVFQQLSSNKSSASFAKLAAAAGCGEVEDTGGSGSGEHLQTGETTNYDTSPPTHGKHAAGTLSAGVYDDPLSEDPTKAENIFRAVHSLEHGAVIVWYDEDLEKKDREELEDTYDDEEKVIVVPYAGLEDDSTVAVTAWGKLAECEKVSTKYIDAFIGRFREARSAPEAKVAI
jgi:hypothetical protein